MTTKHQISCITKARGTNLHELIESVGGVSGTSRWSLSVARAIQAIERGEMEFYVRDSGQVKGVMVTIDSQGNKYLKATDDGEMPDKLLSLQECTPG